MAVRVKYILNVALDYQRDTVQFQVAKAASFSSQKGSYSKFIGAFHIIIYFYTFLPAVVFSATLESDIPINYHSALG